MPFGIPTSWVLCAVLFQSTLFLSSVSRQHNTNFKAFALLQRYWTSKGMILRVQDTSKRIVEVGVASYVYIYTLPGGSHFVLESSASFQLMKLNICHIPCGEISNCAAWSYRPNTTVTLIEQSHNVDCTKKLNKLAYC